MRRSILKILFPLVAIATVFTFAVSCSTDADDAGENTVRLDVDGEKIVRFEEEGGDARIRIISSHEWSALMDLSWCGMDYDDEYVYISVPVNDDTTLRKSKIAITAGSGINTAILVLTVVQSGAGVAWVEFSPADDLVFDAGEGVLTVNVRTNQSTWGLDSLPDHAVWWSAETSAENDAVTVTVQSNPSYEERSAVIRLKAGVNRTNMAYAELKIVQAAKEYPDLSKDGTANCYVVNEAGSYSFDAQVAGNGEKGIVSDRFYPVDANLSPVDARLIWQDGTGLIDNVWMSDDTAKVLFNVAEPFRGGNAVIAVYNTKEQVIWSWHIWMPQTGVSGLASGTGYTVMNMNLGAVNDKRGDTDSFGTLYQWGRKDPFPGASVGGGEPVVYDFTGNEISLERWERESSEQDALLYSIRNPFVFTSSDYIDVDDMIYELWGNSEPATEDSIAEHNFGKGIKSIYDPCPYGWRVPPADVFINATDMGLEACYEPSQFNVVDYNADGETDILDYDNGWELWLDDNRSVSSYFPAAGRYDGSTGGFLAGLYGLSGSYWGNSPFGSESVSGAAAVVLEFQIDSSPEEEQRLMMSPYSTANRYDALSIRCVKDI